MDGLTKSELVGSGKRKRRPADEIRKGILTAAKSEFINSGYSATTSAIAASANVTEGQLYRYYASKSELLQDAVFKPLDKNLSDFGAAYLSAVTAIDNGKARIRLYINQLKEFLNAHPELVVVLAAAHHGTTGQLEPVRQLESLNAYFDIGALMLENRKGKNPQIEARVMARVIFSTVLSSLMFRDWLYAEDSDNLDEIVDAIGDFLIGGVYADPAAVK